MGSRYKLALGYAIILTGDMLDAAMTSLLSVLKYRTAQTLQVTNTLTMEMKLGSLDLITLKMSSVI